MKARKAWTGVERLTLRRWRPSWRKTSRLRSSAVFEIARLDIPVRSQNTDRRIPAHRVHSFPVVELPSPEVGARDCPHPSSHKKVEPGWLTNSTACSGGRDELPPRSGER